MSDDFETVDINELRARLREAEKRAEKSEASLAAQRSYREAAEARVAELEQHLYDEQLKSACQAADRLRESGERRAQDNHLAATIERELEQEAHNLAVERDEQAQAADDAEDRVAELERREQQRVEMLKLGNTKVCDCHEWPTPAEMHEYVVAIEARLRETEERGQTYDAGYERGWADAHRRVGNERDEAVVARREGEARVAELEDEVKSLENNLDHMIEDRNAGWARVRELER